MPTDRDEPTDSQESGSVEVEVLRDLLEQVRDVAKNIEERVQRVRADPQHESHPDGQPD